jgi:RNA polymerase sigma factor (sigma-70 family)
MMGALTVPADGPFTEPALAVVKNAGSPPPIRLTAEDICRNYAATVCRFAAMAAGSDLDADDLAQDALLKAIRSLDRFDPAKGTIDRWLWRIVANVAKDSYRARARRLAMWRRLAARWYEPSGAVEDRALDAIANDELIKAVRTLNGRDRLLIALRFGADLDLRAVGDAIGLSADSAGQAVLRALARLRQRLEVSR